MKIQISSGKGFDFDIPNFCFWHLNSPWHGFKTEYRWRYFVDNFCILYKIVESFSPQKQIFQIRQ